jgi:acetyl esterase/lipase
LSRAGDSEFYFPPADDRHTLPQIVAPYIGSHDAKDPAMSPLFGDLSGLPPTLCVTSTRDLLLSQTVMFHRALLRAAVDARLVVYEGMPHAFWSYLDTPESNEAFEIMAAFLSAQIS